MGAALRERKRPREEVEEREPGVASQMRGVHGHDGCCSAGSSLELREEASSGSHPLLLLCRSSLLLPPLPSSFSLRARHTSCHKPAPGTLLLIHTAVLRACRFLFTLHKTPTEHPASGIQGDCPNPRGT